MKARPSASQQKEHMRTLSTRRWVIGLLAVAGAQLGHAQLPPVPTAQTAAKGSSAAKAPAATGCLIAEFRTIGLSVHNPADRYDRAWNWLRVNAKRCSLEQLQTVNNNRASWLGSSDSPEIMGFVDAIIEYRTQGDEDGLKALYSSKPIEMGSVTVTTGLPERPAPLVQPGNSSMPNGIYMPQPMPYMAPVAPPADHAPQAVPGVR